MNTKMLGVPLLLDGQSCLFLPQSSYPLAISRAHVLQCCLLPVQTNHSVNKDNLFSWPKRTEIDEGREYLMGIFIWILYLTCGTL